MIQNELTKTADRLENSLAYRASFQGKAFVDPHADSSVVCDAQALLKAVQASLQEEERAAPIDDPARLGQIVSPLAWMGNPKWQAAPPSEETPGEPLQTLEQPPSTLVYGDKRYERIEDPGECVGVEPGTLLRLPTGVIDSAFPGGPGSDYNDCFFHGAVRAGSSLYRPVPLPQEPPTPQVVEWNGCTTTPSGYIRWYDGEIKAEPNLKGTLVFIPEGATYPVAAPTQEVRG